MGGPAVFGEDRVQEFGILLAELSSALGLPLLSLLSENGSSGDRRKGRRLGRTGKAGISGWIGKPALVVDNLELFVILYEGGVVMLAESATGVIAKFLGGRDLAIEATKQIDHAGIIIDVGFGIIRARELLKENLGEAGSGSLETDFGKLGSIVAAKEIDEMILVEAVLEDVFLLHAPFEITTGRPVGDVAFGDSEIGFTESGDNVPVRSAIHDHAIDHVALMFRQAGDTAVATDFAGLGGRGQGFGVHHGGGICRGDGRDHELLVLSGWLRIEQLIEGRPG